MLESWELLCSGAGVSFSHPLWWHFCSGPKVMSPAALSVGILSLGRPVLLHWKCQEDLNWQFEN